MSSAIVHHDLQCPVCAGHGVAFTVLIERFRCYQCNGKGWVIFKVPAMRFVTPETLKDISWLWEES